MAEVTELLTEADVDELLEVSLLRPVVLFKHSAACPVSWRAARTFERLDAEGDPPRYRLTVQHARTASNAVAERLGVRHETPQALVLYGGEAVLVQNHGAIRADDLREAARRARA